MSKRRTWSAAEDRILTELYPQMSARDLALRLDRPVSAIYKRCWHLKLSKSPEFLASAASGRLDGIKGMATRFKPGHATWTQGRLGIRLAQHTEFKPGHRPKNAVPVGTVVMATIGFQKIKLAEPHHWCLLHHFEWMRVNGPIPEGHNLQFIDGNHLNCAVDNLRMVSRAAIMKTNSIHSTTPELQELSRLKGSINRAINRIEKKQKEQHA